MTVCIAAICENGSNLVLASDSMITNQFLSIEFEHPTKKMTQLSDSCVAMTAGDALAYTELFNIVQVAIAKLKKPSILKIVDMIKECYQNIRKREIKEIILFPRNFNDFDDFYNAQRILISEVAMTIQRQIDRYDYGLEILLTGITGENAHIYGISDPGTSKCFDAIGFHAIGSGLPHAVNTLIARGCNQNKSLEETLLIIYEAKKMAEKAPGVGKDITDICIMNPKGYFDFPREQIIQLEKIYEKWVRKEENWSNELKELFRKIGVKR